MFSYPAIFEHAISRFIGQAFLLVSKVSSIASERVLPSLLNSNGLDGE
jgi:hypothetical protein